MRDSPKNSLPLLDPSPPPNTTLSTRTREYTSQSVIEYPKNFNLNALTNSTENDDVFQFPKQEEQKQQKSDELFQRMGKKKFCPET